MLSRYPRRAERNINVKKGVDSSLYMAKLQTLENNEIRALLGLILCCLSVFLLIFVVLLKVRYTT